MSTPIGQTTALAALIALLGANIGRADSSLSIGERFVRKTAWVLDHGLRPKVYPKYLGKGPGLGWQDLYNQDETGAYYLEREFELRNTRLDLRITQAYIGDESHPTGRLGLRFPKSHRPVTPTQPEWISTWCRYDDSYPGLLDVLIGGKGLEGVPPKFECDSKSANAFVRCEWRHEAGAVTALFLMPPDDDRLFCEVSVTPNDPEARIAVSLCCWPLGKFTARTATATSPALAYKKTYTLPAGDATVLFGDPALDPKGKSKQGACALTYFPEECSSATIERRFPAFVTLNLAPREGAPIAHAHFVLWELLHRRGDEAFRYVAEKEADTLSMFSRMRGVADPRLADLREKRIEEAGNAMARIDADVKHMRSSPQSADVRCAEFYRDEAVYYLASGDWQRASAALAKAGEACRRRVRD